MDGVRRALVAFVLVMAGIAWPVVARADEPARQDSDEPADRDFVYAVEVWVGERPADADALFGRLSPWLNGDRVMMGGSTISMIEALVSHRGNRIEDAELDAYPARVEKARELYEQNRCGEAIKALDREVTLPWRASLAVATRAPLRIAYRKALGMLAVCKKFVKELEEAKALLAELVRSFPDLPLSREDFGSELWRDFQKIEAELNSALGSLDIEVDDPAVVVYVDEHYVEVGGAHVERPAGRYRILLRKGSGSSTVSRLLTVDIKPGATHKLVVPWRLIEALHSSPSWCCLRYPDKATRDRYLAADMQYLVNQSGYTLIAVTIEPAEPSKPRRFSGAVYAKNTRDPQRRAELSLDAAAPQLQQLAAYWTGKADSPIATDAVDVVARASHERVEADLLPDKVLVGIGAVTMVAGGVAFGLSDVDPDHPTSFWHDPKVQSQVLYIGGACVLGTGAMVWLHDARGMRWLPAALLGLGTCSIATGAMLYITDEDATASAPRFIRNTAKTGAIIGGVGVGAIVAGYLLWRGDKKTGTPMLSLSRAQGSLGWAWEF